MVKDSTKGKLLMVVGAVIVVFGVAPVYIGRNQKPAGFTATEASALASFNESKSIVVGLRPTTFHLVDRAVQGDDTITVAREDTSDKDGPITLYLELENGQVVDVNYAQNGSAN